MEWKMTLLNERIKGREEGLAEGHEKGLAEGHEKGLAEGHEKGLAEGLARGSLMLQIKMITTKVKKGIDLPQIAEAMEIDADLIRPMWEAVKAAAPDYDQEKILQALLGK